MKAINAIVIMLIVSFFEGQKISGKGDAYSESKLFGIVGSILSINVDFDIYKIDMVGYKSPLIYLPPPEWLWHSGCYYLGRPGTPVPSGVIISRFLVKYIPGMYPFAKLHDRFVGYMAQQKYIPDIAYNIPSMAPTFVVAVFAEAVKTVSSIVSWIIQKWGGE